ncbi:hypothetical protein BDV95DRAFT_630344 [Massariosphaeria phaeospora]|uniref:Ubiquitin-like protein DskB n=1 Tax=Massariosphaeria phaeospora TaxID=100035 RepID=A0A7C8I1T6_9PLEO|nr:hypothetical protein BDV95DRAFT_630344 [Massariosphaeria phaeospora]
MADDVATSADETQLTFNIKSANDQKYVVTVPASSNVADLKAKLATAEFADFPAERQRLIYSGRVLKDHDTLSDVKIKDGHTVHLVKGAASNARQNPANQASGGTAAGGSGTPASQVPTNIAAGTGNNPLAGLTGARYAGFHGLPGVETFGADGGMGPPPNPEALLEAMENPMFLSQMNEAMDNPAVIDMMTNSPMIRDNPMLAQMLRNPEMRRMLFNPEMMRMQLNMQRAMGGNQGGSSFPAPGVTDTTPQPSSTATGDGTTATPNQPNTTGPTQPQDPFASLLGNAGGAGANPFASLLGAQGANPFAQPQQNADGTAQPNPFANLFGTPATGAGAGAAGSQSNPIAEATRNMMANPEAMRSMMQMMGSMNGGSADPFAGLGTGANNSNPPTGAAGTTAGTNNAAPNPFAALFGPGSAFGGAGYGTPAPADTRPPEEIYEVQLRQLNEMGFYEFDRNVAALRRSGGNVQGAIEYLLGGAS